jgi:hypothetical protein
MRAAYCVNLQVIISIDRKKQDIEAYYYIQLVDTVRNMLKGIFIFIIMEQCNNQRESKWKR